MKCWKIDNRKCYAIKLKTYKQIRLLSNAYEYRKPLVLYNVLICICIEIIEINALKMVLPKMYIHCNKIGLRTESECYLFLVYFAWKTNLTRVMLLIIYDVFSTTDRFRQSCLLMCILQHEFGSSTSPSLALWQLLATWMFTDQMKSIFHH